MAYPFVRRYVVMIDWLKVVFRQSLYALTFPHLIQKLPDHEMHVVCITSSYLQWQRKAAVKDFARNSAGQHRIKKTAKLSCWGQYFTCGLPNQSFDSVAEGVGGGFDSAFWNSFLNFVTKVLGVSDFDLIVEYLVKSWHLFCEIYRWDWQHSFSFSWWHLIGKACYHYTKRGFHLFRVIFPVRSKNAL